MTSSNAINVTYGELLQITRFEVEIFDTVSNVSLIENTTAEIRCVAEGWPVPRMSLNQRQSPSHRSI
ncbi:hypothetical protein DPMN_029708 [Dreissena polymorpha]|uniref:Uncharacterized protein n=1 Tax=Dreissena polymorpha TaxID=45954 RepID=A0A9D4RFI3_DREPO|nr:hypothetical protein DPMN_029708 [Dreissena polymorpha]